MFANVGTTDAMPQTMPDESCTVSLDSQRGSYASLGMLLELGYKKTMDRIRRVACTILPHEVAWMSRPRAGPTICTTPAIQENGPTAKAVARAVAKGAAL